MALLCAVLHCAKTFSVKILLGCVASKTQKVFFDARCQNNLHTGGKIPNSKKSYC